MSCAKYRNPVRFDSESQCVSRHLPELRASGRVRRTVEENVLERFLECGDLHSGFARIRCGGCGHDLLLAFSCKTRYFRPSCHQKRVLAYGDWVEQCVLRPVAHRQYVFTVPKLIRPFFGYRRSLLGELCRFIARSLAGAYRVAHPRARPGFILFVQTFGDLVNFNPHVHALVADGVFEASGRFIPLPPIPEALLAERLRREVIRLLIRREVILPPLAEQMLAWAFAEREVLVRVEREREQAHHHALVGLGRMARDGQRVVGVVVAVHVRDLQGGLADRRLERHYFSFRPRSVTISRNAAIAEFCISFSGTVAPAPERCPSGRWSLIGM